MKRVEYLVALTILCLSSAVTGATCPEKEPFRRRPFDVADNGSCPWKRGDGRCNRSEDCCANQECSSFGFCAAKL